MMIRLLLETGRPTLDDLRGGARMKAKLIQSAPFSEQSLRESSLHLQTKKTSRAGWRIVHFKGRSEILSLQISPSAHQMILCRIIGIGNGIFGIIFPLSRRTE